MDEGSRSSYLTDNTVLFANAVVQVIRDMIGAEMLVTDKVQQLEQFKHSPGIVVSIHFSGVIQGEYILALEELTAARLIGAAEEDTPFEQMIQAREDYVGFLKEVLNTAVGIAIQNLENDFEGLTFLPSVVVWGQIEFPQVPVGVQRVVNELGSIDCCFLLNMMNLGVGEKLQQALQDIQASNSQLRAASDNIQNMLKVFPAGLVSVDKSGTVLPGHSHRTAETVGISENDPIQGSHLVDLLAPPPEKRESVLDEYTRWADLVYSRWGTIEHKTMEELFPLSEFHNAHDRILRLRCIPVLTAAGNQVDRLLFVIEDITQQRKMEDEMRRISKQHDQNLELISQVINLEPDEITQFVYDSSDLISRAEGVLQSHQRDRDFINTLYRTIHTLKGTSGQFRFKQLQEMAHSIENQISPLRQKDQVEETEVEPIKKSLEEVNNYVTRVEDLRKKLGGEKETIRAKAERNKPTMMVPLSDIDTLINKSVQILEVGRKLEKDKYFLSALDDVVGSVRNLRKLNLGFFVPSLNALAQRTAERTGKKARIELKRDVRLDIDALRRLHEALIHIVNNAVDHGIELPAIRTEKGKIDTGIIQIDSRINGDRLEISIQDDGNGIDIEQVKEKLVERMGYAPAKVQLLTNQEVYVAIFQAGFSTKDVVSETSGRGIGMDVVAAAAKELGGSVRAISSSGKGTEILFSVPIERTWPTFVTPEKAA